MSDALTRILNSKRPYKPFQFKLAEDEEITLYARRPGSIETARVNKAFEVAFAEAKHTAPDPDDNSLYALLKRQTVERLAVFITKADRRDYLNEASMLNDNAPIDDGRVKKDADDIEEHKKSEYLKTDHGTLLDLAWDRRAHYTAIEDAQNASNYMMAVVTVFTKNADNDTYSPLFDNIEQAKELPLDSLVDLMTEALQVIAEDKHDSPLSSVKSTSSDEPTSSPDEKAAESPSPTSSGP